MQITDKALADGAITQDEADAIENWIDCNCEKTMVVVPDYLMKLWQKVNLYNHESELMQ